MIQIQANNDDDDDVDEKELNASEYKPRNSYLQPSYIPNDEPYLFVVAWCDCKHNNSTTMT